MEITLILSALIAALAAVLTAIFTLLIVVSSSKSAKKMRRVSRFESILLNMGSSSRETIVEYRQKLKKWFIARGEDGKFERIRKKSEFENSEFEEIKNITDTKNIILGLSANFNRACAVTVSALDKKLTQDVIHLLGDAFMDYWSICFEILREEQEHREDPNNRMFFEYMAYLSYHILSREERTPETTILYDEESEIRNYMLNRIKKLESAPALKKFAKLMGKIKTRR